MSVDFWIALPPDLQKYRDLRPTKEVARREGIPDRSQCELDIFRLLLRKGWNEKEILEYAQFHELARNMEDLATDGNTSATRSRISAAERWLNSLAAATTDLSGNERKQEAHTTPHHVLEIGHNQGFGVFSRSYASGYERTLALRIVREWDERQEVHSIREWREALVRASGESSLSPISARTARRITEQTIRDGAVFTEAINGRSRAPHLTESGRRKTEPSRHGFARAHPRKGFARPPVKGSIDEHKPEGELEPPTDAQPPDARPRKPRDRRRLHIVRYRKQLSLNGYHRLRFDGRKTRYVQLLAPISDAVSGPLWLSLPTGYDDECLPRFATIVGEDDPDDDPLTALMPPAWRAREYHVLPAAELTKTKAGFALAEHTNDLGELRPSVGIIAEPRFPFFDHLGAIDTNGRIIEVKASGQKPRKRYAFTAVADALPVEHNFAFDEFLADLVSDRHLKAALPLPEGWFRMRPERREVIHTLTHPNDSVALGQEPFFPAPLAPDTKLIPLNTRPAQR